MLWLMGLTLAASLDERRRANRNQRRASRNWVNVSRLRFGKCSAGQGRIWDARSLELFLDGGFVLLYMRQKMHSD